MSEVITDIALQDLPSFVESFGLKDYAASQIVSWLYKKRVLSFGEMTDLTKQVRDRLNDKFLISAVKLVKTQNASDGTKKFLYRCIDGAGVECVIIPALDGRTTVCISTQAGCAMGCSFCRTAGVGFRRNLTQGEILGQLIFTIQNNQDPLTNVVLMGMGEPLANLKTVSNAVKVMLDGRAFGFSKRRITLSTSGLLPELKEFCEMFDIKIAISLNATTDEVRTKLMPINRRYPIAEIMAFCREYSKKTRHRITFEYVLIAGVNDSKEDVGRLALLLKGLRAKINLIPFNPFEGCDYKAPELGVAEEWQEFLHNKGIQANVRASRGQEILAACGQLASCESLRNCG